MYFKFVANLASTHTIFVIKHNHIADELSQTNPHWNDERLFQVTVFRILLTLIANFTLA